MKFAAAIALACLTASAAFAADARKINFSAEIQDENGTPIVECANPSNILSTDPACKERRTVTLGIIAFRALSAAEQGVSPDDNLLRGQLALSLYKGGEVELTAEQVVLVKKRIGSTFSPVIVARCFPLLDPAIK
jgi:hypothetical protein